MHKNKTMKFTDYLKNQITTKINESTKHLSKYALYKIGKFDSGGRYYLDSDFDTETSLKIRQPSRAFLLVYGNIAYRGNILNLCHQNN